MKKARTVLLVLFALRFSAAAQTSTNADFKLVLPEHRGRLSWSADEFKVVQASAKPGGREIGIRGKDRSGRLAFLGFLFLGAEPEPLTSAKCRDRVLALTERETPTLKILGTTEKRRPGDLPISMVTYSARGRDGKQVYSVRGFIATGDICGDLEVYSDSPIIADDARVQKIFSSYQLDANYSPQFDSVFFYAQTLYQARMYEAAAPMFEAALVKIKEEPSMAATMMGDKKTATRVVTDQAGMAYGLSGNLQKARRLFASAIIEDPDYPMYYYNLACADAEEKSLADARNHLQQAFARKANVISGESMPDPTKDESFLPYRSNKEFWAFLESLQAKQ